MPDKPSSNVPARTLDRAALERVLARAAELQAGSADPGEAMTEGQLLDLGKEVGLTPEFLRQAIAEEQTRVAVPDAPSGVGGMFGPTFATASRIVNGTQAQVLEQLDRWMQEHELLQVKRRYSDRITWEARRDFWASMKRGFNQRAELGRAGEIGATVVPIDDTKVIVRLDADLASSRRQSAGWATAVGGGSVAASTGLVAVAASTGGSLLITGLIAGAWTIAGGATFFGMARSQRASIARAQLALEQVLDALEHGQLRRPPTLLESIADAAGFRTR